MLVEKDKLTKMWVLRRILMQMGTIDAMEFLLDKMKDQQDQRRFLQHDEPISAQIMAEVILVVGCTGAGKTTYARQLADEIGGIRFSIDEWMMPLFGPDQPQPIRFDWMMERVNRCEAMIFAMVLAGCRARTSCGA